MRTLELLSPARTADIGIAAIDCGADAVYIAGPCFGARRAAGNSVEDIARLCSYAHRFGARIYATVNTIIYDEEIEEARSLVRELASAGADGLIVQDPAVLSLAEGLGLAMHASTQCAVRTPEKARFTESLGYGRLVLERQMSLEEIKAVRKAVDAELEFFVHGALCVSYSGQCYLSEYLTGRSANRGECAQACRSLYNLEDSTGKILRRNQALLSLRDFRLLNKLEELALAGICSFKIEGRLKGENYVRNVVKAYSEALNALVEKYPGQYRRSSFGHVTGGFKPDLDKTFNRGYTELFIDGKRGRWAAEGGGEYIGRVSTLTQDGFVLEPASSSVQLSNGDGFTFTGKDGGTVGFRADSVSGLSIRSKRIDGLVPGVKLYRNLSAAFEKSIEAGKPVREIHVLVDVDIDGGDITLHARAEDGRVVEHSALTASDTARDPEKAIVSILNQLEKRSSIFSFKTGDVRVNGPVPFLAASFINGLRRTLSEKLDATAPLPLPLKVKAPDTSVKAPSSLDYKANIANAIDRTVYASRGTKAMEDAYEITHRPGAELMRSKYCVRHELGLCPKQKKGLKPDPLYLENAGRRLKLVFHCPVCEMTVED
ncbi:MAG: DUF3656 domain-containing protein [Bacteroidales bacterium]|nr:DUF3656 domain-containing protein [Bacteroidales bacterium]